MSAVTEGVPAAPPERPTRAHWFLAIRWITWLILLLALPVFLWAGWDTGGWLLCAGLWTVQKTIQGGVNRYVLDLPPTPAVGVAGFAFLTRAWGTIIVLLLAEHFWGTEVAIPAAILFTVLYTIDVMARGLAWAESKREPREGQA